MSNSSSFRSYPYVREVWQDPSGTDQWTLATSHAAVISALLAMLVSVALGRVITIVYTLFHMLFLHKMSRTLVDDQVNTIAANSYNPSVLLWSLFQFGYFTGRRAFRSKVGRALLIIGLLFVAAQAGIIVAIGKLVSNQPTPYSP